MLKDDYNKAKMVEQYANQLLTAAKHMAYLIEEQHFSYAPANKAIMLPFMAAGMANMNWGKVAKWGGLILVATVAFFVIRKQIKNFKEKKHAQNTNIVSGESGVANILADRARTAMKGPGTNEKALYDIANVIARGETTFEKVANAFFAKFGRNLSDDIRSELNSKELKKFYGIMGRPVEGLQGLGGAAFLY